MLGSDQHPTLKGGGFGMKKKSFSVEHIVGVLKQSACGPSCGGGDPEGWGSQRTEEAGGLVRWLRPEFQAPHALPTQATLGGQQPADTAIAKLRKQPCPGALTDQVRAIKDSLRAQPLQTPRQIASGFKPACRTRVIEILETLTALGQTRLATEDRYTL
jgi:hypothetical protein